jgi:dipeptidyl-peptidase-4
VPWVDTTRLGLFGWSYGGFLAARAALDGNSPFAAHVAVAPVTEFALYDTHYTERYLGMPEGGKAPAYVQTDLVARARLLDRPLLILHGTADDNVLFENTLRLVEALQKEGKLFELMIYPGKAHGIAGKDAQLHVYKTITAFFDRELHAGR